MKTNTTNQTEIEPTLSQSIEKVVLTLLAAFLTTSIVSILCYFPGQWAYPENHPSVAQWFFIVLIAKLLKAV